MEIVASESVWKMLRYTDTSNLDSILAVNVWNIVGILLGNSLFVSDI